MRTLCGAMLQNQAMHLDRRAALTASAALTLAGAAPAAAGPAPCRRTPPDAYALDTWQAYAGRAVRSTLGPLLLVRVVVLPGGSRPTERGLVGDRFRLHLRSLRGTALGSELVVRLPGIGRVPLMVTPHGSHAVALIDRRVPERF